MGYVRDTTGHISQSDSRGLHSFPLLSSPLASVSTSTGTLALKGVVRADLQGDRRDWLGALSGHSRREEEGARCSGCKQSCCFSIQLRDSRVKQKTEDHLAKAPSTLPGAGPTTALKS